MRIGVDIDGVLTELERYEDDHFAKFLVENQIPYKIKEKDVTYNLHDTYGVKAEIEDKFWDKYYIDYCKNVRERDFAAEVIGKLKEEGNEIYIITARWFAAEKTEFGKVMRRYIRQWLKKHGVVYDKLVFVGGKSERKTKEIQENNIEIMIEDSPININTLSKLIPVICVSCRYNESCEGDNIIRCYSWYDIYNKLHKRFLDKLPK